MPQGTIRSFDPATGSGSLLDDELVELPFAGHAMRASGLRSFASGSASASRSPVTVSVARSRR